MLPALSAFLPPGERRAAGENGPDPPAAGRQPRWRTSELMIVATAASYALPLYTANPDDLKGAEGLVEVVAVHGRPNDF
jgi:hypothetical protein